PRLREDPAGAIRAARGRKSKEESMKTRVLAVPLFVIAALGFQIACASNQTPASQVLMTENPAKIKGCKMLGQVQGSDPAWSTNGEGFSTAQSEVRNQASQLGADTVFVLSSGGAGGAYGGASVHGEAYR